MPLLLGSFKHDWAFAVGSDALWYAVGPTGPVSSAPTCALADVRRNQLVAIADSEDKLRRQETDVRKVVHFARHGGFTNTAVAGQVLNKLYRKAPGARWLLAPRVVAVGPDVMTFSVRTAAMTGARAVITLPAHMAAAIGAGLPIGEPRLHSVLVLDRDWCTYGLIRQNQLLASFEIGHGMDELLQDVAAHALATRGSVMDPDAAHRWLCTRGLTGIDFPGWDAWRGEWQAGAKQPESHAEIDLRRSALPFVYGLRWHHQCALAKLDPAVRRLAATEPLYVCGPYARIPGFAEALAQGFECRIEIPAAPEKAMILGAQKVLADLRSLLGGAGK